MYDFRDNSTAGHVMWVYIYKNVCTTLKVILLLVILVMRKRIGLTVTLFHEAGKCLADVPILLLQPLWTFIILVFFFVYWIIILAFLATAGKLTS